MHMGHHSGAGLSYLHSRDVTYAVFCQGPYEESARYRDFMGWHMPWSSALPSVEQPSRRSYRRHDAHRRYLRDGGRVF